MRLLAPKPPVSPLEDQEVFAWTFPGSPVSIYLPIDLVYRIGQWTSARHGPGPEKGGLLLGRVLSPGALEIMSGQPVQPGAGGLLAAISAARSAHAAATDEYPAGYEEAPAVVGYYRTHTRYRLCLEDADRSLIASEFPGPGNAFLLVRPEPFGPSTAGFFFWEGNRIEGDFCYLEFPLNPVVLPVEPRPLPAPMRHAEFAFRKKAGIPSLREGLRRLMESF